MPVAMSGSHLAAAVLYMPTTLLGTIVATTTKNNHDTASAFNNTGEALKGLTLLIQPDAACYMRSVTTNSGTATTSNGMYVDANERLVCTMGGSAGWLAVVSASGTCNVKVWLLG